MNSFGKLPNVQSVANKLQQILQPTQLGGGFHDLFSEAVAGLQNADSQIQIKKARKKRLEEPIGNDLLAQAPGAIPGGVNQAALGAQAQNLNRVPIQLFLDRAVLALDNLSKQEFRVNDLIEGFVEGRVTEDDVIIETAKLNLAMSMVTTIVQTSVQTFKEIQQIAV